MRPAGERWARVKELFEAAVDLDPNQRTALLDKECGGDEALRDEIESLLKSDERTDGFIEHPAFALPGDLFPDDMEEPFVGRQFGAYQLISEIGRGGLGAVYLAARANDEYRKQVAIKVIRRGLDTDDIIRRFRNERQILAQLDHPNIARLIDGGTTDDGLPYFVMEYVNGEPINAYCDANVLPTAERLQLFRKVCAAVSYAHQNLVIHRDLKPANIRVTAEGEPKLLDFGIARLLDPETAQTDNQTMPAVRAMTPNYASPEQLRGERMTTASDVYSLGVVLYELLAGQKPGLRKDGEADLKKLDADLDNIVFKSLRLEPERRYSSVGQFSEDIRRYLEGLPVIARKDTVAYRTSKFVGRHKLALAATASVAFLLIGATIVATWEAHRANEQRILAERRFKQVRRLADSLMFEIHDSVKDLAGSTPTRRLIVSRALEYLDSLGHDAGGNVALQRELATAYEKIGDIQGNPYSANIGDTDGALTSYKKAARIRESFQPAATTAEMQME